MTRFNPEKVLILYSIIGALFLVYVALAPSFSAVYVAVLVSVLFGPCWATIYAGTLDTVDNEHTELAGAVIVMAIVGAAVVPAIQGYVADMFHSLQLSFLVSMLCFVYVGIYSGVKAKCAITWLKRLFPEESDHDNTYHAVAGTLCRDVNLTEE